MMSGFGSTPVFGQQTTTSSSLFGTNNIVCPAFSSSPFGTQSTASQPAPVFGQPTGTSQNNLFAAASGNSSQPPSAFGQTGRSVFGQTGFGQTTAVTTASSNTSSVFGQTGFGQTSVVTTASSNTSSVFGNISTVFGQGGASQTLFGKPVTGESGISQSAFSAFGKPVSSTTSTTSAAPSPQVFGGASSTFGKPQEKPAGNSLLFGKKDGSETITQPVSVSNTLFGKKELGGSGFIKQEKSIGLFGKDKPETFVKEEKSEIKQEATDTALFGKPKVESRALFGKPKEEPRALFGKPKEEPNKLFGKPTIEMRTLFGKDVKNEDEKSASSGQSHGQEQERAGTSARQLFGKPAQEDAVAASNEGENGLRARRGFRTQERRLFGKVVPQKSLGRISESKVPTEQRQTQESGKGPRTPMQRQLSEDLSRKVSIVCKQVPTKYNNQLELKRHFRRFGFVTKVFPNVNKMQATIHFKTHEEAAEGKRRGRIISRGMPPMSIFWSTYQLPSSPTEGAAGKNGDKPFARSGTSADPSGKSQRWKDLDAVGDEIKSMAGPTPGPSNPSGKQRRWKDLDAVGDEIKSMAGTSDMTGPTAGPSRSSTGVSARREPSPVPVASDSKMEKVSLNQLHGMVARTTTEKVQVLNMRDKYLRQNTKKSVTVDVQSAKAFAGTCKDMCPEKERYDREDKRRLSIYEIVPGTENIPGRNPVIDHSRAVKEYIRSSPDQDEPLPHELRPLPVLQQTMTYLLKEVANQGEDGRWGDWFDFLWNRTRGIRKPLILRGVKKQTMIYLLKEVANQGEDGRWGDWFDFLWNRTRGIRKDITQQQLCDRFAAELLEKCARFHIYCSERLCEEDMHSFDAKINNENLTKCLQTLKEFYADLEKKQKIFCPSEAEFRAYTVLMNLNEGDTLREVQKLRPEVRASSSVRFALDVYFALSSNNYIKFFKLLKNASFSNACIMHRYFPQVRIKALISMMKGYRPGSKPAQIPLSELVRLLAFESTSEAGGFCSHYGFETTQDEVILDRNKYMEPDTAWAPFRSKNYIESKLMVTCGEMINGDVFPADYQLLAPQSSFDQYGRLVFDGKIMPTDNGNDPKPLLPSDRQLVPDQSVTAQTVAPSQPAVSKQPALIAVPAEFIKDTAKVLFWEVTDEMIAKLSQDSMADVKSLLEQSDQYTDLIVRTVVEKETEKIVEEIIAEINAEKLRKEAEELAARKERVSEELVEGILYDILYHETNDIAKMEYREVLHQLKKERIERATDEIHKEYINNVSDSVCKDIAAEVFETDVTQRLQAMERAEKAVQLLRTKRFFEIWKKYYRYVLKLKRAVTEFPPSAAMVSLEVQNQNLTGHADNKIVDKQFLVGRRAKLTVQSQLEIMKERESNEYKCAIQDLKRTMQTVLAWQPEDVTKIVSNILMRKVKSRASEVVRRAKLTVQSQLEIMKERESNEYKCAIQDLKRTMQTVLAWQPEDVTKIVSNILMKKVKSRGSEGKSHKIHMQWKMLISLPETPANKPKREDHMATKMLCDWFTRKFSFGSPPQNMSHEKCEVLTLTKSSHMLGEGSLNKGILHLGVCVRSVEGTLAPSDVDTMKEDRTLQGTSGMIFVLPTPVRDLQNPDTTYWSNNLDRLRSVLEAGRTKQPISLVIVMATEPEDYGKHESVSCVSDNLQLEDLIEDGLIFDYHFVELKFDESLYHGIEVTKAGFYKKICEGIEWIADRSDPPPQLKVSALRDFIDTVLIRLFYPPMLQNLKQRKESGYLERSPNSILELYNSVLDHAKYVVTSPSLCDYSWPVPEFVSTDSCTLPAKHWNVPEYMEYIGEILDYFKLPEFVITNPESELWTDAKQDVNKYCTDRIGVKSLVIWANLNSLLRQVEDDFSEKCQLYKGEVGCQPFYVHLPFSKIVPLCAEHKMETADFRDYNMDTGKMGCVEELRVAYNETELWDFSPPVEWRHQEAEESFKGSPSLEMTLQVAASRKVGERSMRKTKHHVTMDMPSEVVQTKKKAGHLIDAIRNEQTKSENFIKHLEEELAKGEAELNSFSDLSKINWNQGKDLARRKSFGGHRRKSEEFDLGDKGKRPRKRYSEIGLDVGDLTPFPLLSLENNVESLRNNVKKFGDECVNHQERMMLDIEYNEMLLSRLAKDGLQHETF